MDEDDESMYSEHDPEGIQSVTEFASRVKVPFAMAVASKRNTGKTLLVSALIQNLIATRKIDVALVMSQTVHVNDDYAAVVPPRMRQPFSEDVIKKLMDKQASTPKEKRVKENKILLVLDDVLSDKDAERSRFIKRLYTLGRHYDINVVLISQTSNVALTPAIKQNADYLLYSRLNRYQLATLWESITNMDKRDFIRYSEENNKNFTFLVVDNTSQSNDPDDFLLKVRVSEEEAAQVIVHKPEIKSEDEAESDASWEF